MKTITVKELRELLSEFNDDDKVIFSSNYGDRARTEQAHRIRGVADYVGIAESAYSDSGYRVIADHDDEDGDEDLGQFVLIQ